MRIHLWGCLVAVVIALTASSCTTKGGRDQESGGNKPVARGLPYELVMVVPRGLYTGELKDSLDAVLLGSTPVLPQHEPLFRLDVAYTDANLTPWRTFRNRLIVETDAHVKEPQMGVARNVMARGQIEVKVSARTAHELAEFISVHRQRLTDLFVEHELEYEAENLRRRHDPMTGDSAEGAVWPHDLRAACIQGIKGGSRFPVDRYESQRQGPKLHLLHVSLGRTAAHSRTFCGEARQRAEGECARSP